MANRIGWGANGGDTLGDVKAALAGRSFGEVFPAQAFSPSKVVIDCSLGDSFYITTKASAATPIRIGAPINYADGSEVTLVLKSSSTINTVVFSTSASAATWKLASATFTLVASKTRMVQFKYLSSLGAFVELSRTLVAGA
jgi:hypothetical protein